MKLDIKWIAGVHLANEKRGSLLELCAFVNFLFII